MHREQQDGSVLPRECESPIFDEIFGMDRNVNEYQLGHSSLPVIVLHSPPNPPSTITAHHRQTSRGSNKILLNWLDWLDRLDPLHPIEPYLVISRRVT